MFVRKPYPYDDAEMRGGRGSNEAGSGQQGEPFLGEVGVARQYLGDPLRPHRRHRGAVGEAVILVRTGFVEGQGVQERVPGLGDDLDVGVDEDPRLLKCLCQTEEEKTVAWHSDARSLERQRIPREFTTRSRVAIISNDWKTQTQCLRCYTLRGQ